MALAEREPGLQTGEWSVLIGIEHKEQVLFPQAPCPVTSGQWALDLGLKDLVETYLQRWFTGRYILFLDQVSSSSLPFLRGPYEAKLIYYLNSLFLVYELLQWWPCISYCKRLNELIFELANILESSCQNCHASCAMFTQHLECKRQNK